MGVLGEAWGRSDVRDGRDHASLCGVVLVDQLLIQVATRAVDGR